jgi:hypothetical protein
LKILKEKPIKSIKIKVHFYISIMYPLGTKTLTNEKKSFQGLLKTRSNLAMQKVHNYHDLVEVSQKQIHI